MDSIEALKVLRLFEGDVANRGYAQAEECLLWLLDNSSVHGARPDKVFLSQYDDREVAYVATRIASGICQLFGDQNFGVKDEDFFKYAIGHACLSAILSASGFGTADHVIENLLEPLESDKAEVVTRQTFNKILLLHGIHSEVKIPYEDYVGSHPQHLLWMILVAVGAIFCVTERENTARNHLIKSLIHKLDVSAFDTKMLGWLCIAWMHCSYATISERNFFKKDLNRMLVHWMASIGIEQQQAVEPEMRHGKPVLLVINEYFTSGHAMYRCYAPTIDALKQHFYVIGITHKTHCDEKSKKHFNYHYDIEGEISNKLSLDKILDLVKKIKPHAVYYPSVGMNISCVILHNLRLAPCQFMSLGHPASSHSSVMDYVLVENQFLADRTQFSEEVFILEDNAGGFVPHMDQPPRSELLSWKKKLLPGEPVRIIITGSAMKVNAEFVKVLANIEQESKRPVEFHFIPNLNRISICIFRKKLESVLKRFVVHPSMSYRDYLATVSRCQLHMSPFPFGSTNSLVDSMLLGLPLIVMRVLDSEQSIDSVIVDKLKIASMKPATNVDEYIAFACSLIDNDEERESLTKKIENADVEKIFFSSHGDALKKSAKKLFDLVVSRNADIKKSAASKGEPCRD